MIKQRLIFKTFGDYLLKCLPIYAYVVEKNELIIYVPFRKIGSIFLFLRDHTVCQYKILVDLAGVDYPSRGRFRFDVVYQLLSIRFNSRLRLKTSVQEGAKIPTATICYRNADWLEREAYDMFGLFFKNHKDLRRILTDYGFKGHPLRKDFPLTGFLFLRYIPVERKLTYLRCNGFK